MLLENYTFLGEQGTRSIMKDILSTKKYRAEFADVFSSHQKSSSDDKLLTSIAKDYIAAKDKDSSRLIRAQGAKVTSKLLIGDSTKGSKLNVSALEQGRNRVDTARAIGRVSKFGDERRRLLSIVAQDFSMSEIQKYFPCSKSTITAARVHAILFGKGGHGLTFTRQAVSPEVVPEFHNFIKMTSQDPLHVEVCLWMERKPGSGIGSVTLKMLSSNSSLSSLMVLSEPTFIHICQRIFE